MKLITGMHRSGTSMIARIIHECGGDFGDTSTFYPPDKWNPQGYFEQIEIHAINIPLINGPLGKLAYFNLPSTSTILNRSDEFNDQIVQVNNKYMGKFVKENRFCLTLDAWLQQHVNIECIIYCLREPMDVAKSLRKRNWVTLNYGLKLWKIHNDRLLSSITSVPVHFVLYNNLLNEESFQSEMVSVFDFCDVDYSKKNLQNIFRTSVHKTKWKKNDQYTYPSEIAELWEDLLNKHRAQKMC